MMQVDSDKKELILYFPPPRFLEREPVNQLMDLHCALTVGASELCKAQGCAGWREQGLGNRELH